MRLSKSRALKLVSKYVDDITNDRIKIKKGNNYENGKDGMLDLHGRWQDMVSAVRSTDISGLSSKSALYLCAVAVKFATDLGDLRDMRLSESDSSIVEA